jgi:vacuolar protein sorting-associated protein VTA1
LHRTTASNLLAASNFLELLKLFSDPDQGLLDRIKYCKFHAARILKSFASGEDPNEYEPPDVTSEGHTSEPESTRIDDLSSSAQRVSLDGTTSAHSLSSTPSFPVPSSPPPLALGSSPVAAASAPPLTFTPPLAAPPGASTSQPQSYHHQQKHQVSKTEVQQIMDEAERFSLAQKHSRYAISALNYEDVDTAVKELKAALNLLGENVS